MAGDKSKAAKELLRSTLRAWNELATSEASAWAAPLVSTDELDTPEQRTKLIVAVLFQGWKRYTASPPVKERQQRKASNAEWIQRMTALIPSRVGDASSGEDEESTRKEASRRYRNAKYLGSRYLRLRTVPPDRVKYGRSPGAPPLVDVASTTHKAEARSTSIVSPSYRKHPAEFRVDTSASAEVRESKPLSQIDDDGDESDVDYSWCSRGRSVATGRLIAWEDMEPWQQRSAAAIVSGQKGRGGRAVIAPADRPDVTREVSRRLHRYASLERRQAKALAICRKHIARAHVMRMLAGARLNDKPRMPDGDDQVDNSTFAPSRRCRPGERFVDQFACNLDAGVGDAPEDETRDFQVACGRML